MASSNNSGDQRIGKWMIFAAWILGFALLLVYFNNFMESEQNPNQKVVTRVGESGETEVVLKRNRYGHYVSSGKINGQAVLFFLDTGATNVAIPASVADRLSLKRGAQQQYRTANGRAMGYATMLDSVSIGPLEMSNVRASINPGLEGNEILLGMSVLKRLEFTQRGDTLILRPFSE